MSYSPRVSAAAKSALDAQIAISRATLAHAKAAEALNQARAVLTTCRHVYMKSCEALDQAVIQDEQGV